MLTHIILGFSVLAVSAASQTITNGPLNHPTRLEVNLGPTPIDSYDSSNCLPGAASCSTDVTQRYVGACSSSHTVRQCYQAALAAYSSQEQVTGVRFQFALCGGYYSTPLTGCGSSSVQFDPYGVWQSKISELLADIAASGIRNVTFSPALSGFGGDQGYVTGTLAPYDLHHPSASVADDCNLGTLAVQWWPALPYPILNDGTGRDYGTDWNHAYNCAPPNSVNFVGWANIYSALESAISIAGSAGLSVEELEIANEMRLADSTVEGRLIVDNMNSNEEPWAALGTYMASVGFRGDRVTASVTSPGTNVAGFDCGNVYGDSARLLPLSELIAAGEGGLFGHPDDTTQTNFLSCGTGYSQMTSLPIARQNGQIVDLHTGPCLLDGSGDCAAGQAQSSAAAEATLTFSDTQSLLSSYCSGGWRAGNWYNGGLCTSLYMQGEVPLYAPNPLSPGANCDGSPIVVPAGAVQGFNASSMSGRMQPDGTAGVVFRPWVDATGQHQPSSSVVCYGFPAQLQPTYVPQ